MDRLRNYVVTHKAPVLLFVAFAVVGAIVIVSSFAETTTTNTASDCGKRVANYTYRVPFGDSPWNTPACNLAPYGNNEATGKEWGKKLFEYGQAWNASSDYWQQRIGQQKGNFMTQFGLNGDANDYGTPIYYANASTGRKQVKLCSDEACYRSNLDTQKCHDDYAYYTPNGQQNVNCFAPNASIPWDSSWRPSGSTNDNYADDATDKEMIIVDSTTGLVYELWRVNFNGSECIGRDFWYALSQKSPENRLCVGGANIIRDKSGNPANYYTYNQGVFSARGMGIQNAAMIVTPEEVKAGEIRHALTMEAFNTMFGPTCSAEQLTKNYPNYTDKSCGFAVAPATTHEWASARDISRNNQCSTIANSTANRTTNTTFRSLMTSSTTVPEGMRFRITFTDAEIENWLNSKWPASVIAQDPTLAATKRTARIFAVALRDYGWIVGDTTCYGAGFTVAGAANTAAKKQWADLGIKDGASQNLLSGLFTANNITALDPPENTCLNGKTSKMACPFTASKYPATVTTTTPAPTPAPAPTAPPATSPQPTTTPSPTFIPPTPSNVTASLIGETKWNDSIFGFDSAVTLSWNESSDPQGIKEYIVTKDNGLGTFVEKYRGKTQQYTDFAASSGGSYRYRVYAYSNAGALSNPTSIGAKLTCALFDTFFCSATKI